MATVHGPAAVAPVVMGSVAIPPPKGVLSALKIVRPTVPQFVETALATPAVEKPVVAALLIVDHALHIVETPLVITVKPAVVVRLTVARVVGEAQSVAMASAKARKTVPTVPETVALVRSVATALVGQGRTVATVWPTVARVRCAVMAPVVAARTAPTVAPTAALVAVAVTSFVTMVRPVCLVPGTVAPVVAPPVVTVAVMVWRRAPAVWLIVALARVLSVVMELVMVLRAV